MLIEFYFVREGLGRKEVLRLENVWELCFLDDFLLGVISDVLVLFVFEE